MILNLKKMEIKFYFYFYWVFFLLLTQIDHSKFNKNLCIRKKKNSTQTTRERNFDANLEKINKNLHWMNSTYLGKI